MSPDGPWNDYTDPEPTGPDMARTNVSPSSTALPPPALSGAPAPTPLPAANVPALNGPWHDYAQPAPITDTGTTRGFADEAPVEATHQLSPEDTAAFYKMFRGDGVPRATADQLRQFVGSKGLTLQNADSIVDARDKGGGVVGAISYPLPKVQPADGVVGATARGVGTGATLGFLDEAGAVADTLGGTAGRQNLWNSNQSFGDLYHQNLDQNRGILASDEENHPFANIGGQLLGGLVIPIGLEKAGLTASVEAVGLNAGRAALREGATLEDARIVAQRAVTRRIVAEGAGYGGVYGAGSANGDLGDRATGAITGAAQGALTGGVLGKIGEAVAPSLAARAASLRAAPDVPDYASIADRLNIVPTPATTGGPLARTTQMGLHNLPAGMDVISAGVDRENTGLADAARATAEKVGDVSSRAGAGSAVADGANAYSRTSKAEATTLYGQRDALYGGTTAPVDLDNTRQAYANVAGAFPSSPALAQLNEHPVLRSLSTALPTDGPISLGEATDALSHVRGVQRNLAARNDATGAVLNRVGTVEQALENDVKSAGRQADLAAGRPPGPGSAEQAQTDADAFYADRKAALNGSLKSARLSAQDPIAVPGETVYNRLLANTQRKGGNFAQLKDTWDRLPDKATSTFAATALDDMGRAQASGQNTAGDAWSFNTFLTNFDKMSPQAKSLMYGGKADDEIRDIAAYAGRLRDLDKSRNFSNTAKNIASGVLLGAVGRAFIHGDFAGVAETSAALPAAYIGAKFFLSTQQMRRWTTAALRTATLSDPVQARSSAATLTSRLGSIAKADPTIATDALGLQTYLRNALSQSPGRAAATQNVPNRGEEPPQQQGQRSGVQPPPAPATNASILQNMQ